MNTVPSGREVRVEITLSLRDRDRDGDEPLATWTWATLISERHTSTIVASLNGIACARLSAVVKT